MIRLDIHPSGHPFEAKVHAHATGVPFSTLAIEMGDYQFTLFAKADDALKLIRVATLLNEVFASEKVEAGE